MPEGQVSHRNARRFAAALTGRELTRVEAPEPRLAPQDIPGRLAGDAIAGAQARGKHHLLRFRSGRLLHSHLMMSGMWRLLPAGASPQRRGLFLALHTEAGVAALYRCPRVRLLEPGAPEPRDLAATGPDLLDPAIDPAAATAAALARADPGREVGDALMDQRLVSGIGNVYKSETCFLAGIDPWRPLGDLSADEAGRLGEVAAALLAQGVADGGPIRTHRPPAAAPWSRERTWVYGRGGRPCRHCATPILARGQGEANRTTYWCPSCQDRPPADP